MLTHVREIARSAADPVGGRLAVAQVLGVWSARHIEYHAVGEPLRVGLAEVAAAEYFRKAADIGAQNSRYQKNDMRICAFR